MFVFSNLGGKRGERRGRGEGERGRGEGGKREGKRGKKEEKGKSGKDEIFSIRFFLIFDFVSY